MRLLSNLHVKGKPAVLPDRAIRRQSHYFIYRPRKAYVLTAHLFSYSCVLFWPLWKPKGKVKVKCTLVQALRLCTGRTAHRGSRGIALPFHDHSIRRGWGVGVTPRPLFTPWKDSVPIVQKAGWAPGPVWTGSENLAPTGIQSPDSPAR